MTKRKSVNAMPTKSFFVEMFTKDIPLDQAVLDLVDNSVDAARRKPKKGNLPLEGYSIRLTFDGDQFLLTDNCGGFTSLEAADYAFRFGRPAGAKREANSIGRFGVGMKRALFKFGDKFDVLSATADEEWAISVDVDVWEDEDTDWDFPWSDFDPTTDIAKAKPGTEVCVTELHQSVSKVFRSESFRDQIIKLIKTKHREFIQDGIEIRVNNEIVPNHEVNILYGNDIKPSVTRKEFKGEYGGNVTVRIIAGVGKSAPRNAGWYIICNGRLVRDADKRTETGWGVVEDFVTKTSTPGFHNQFARFRGVVFFESSNSMNIPWNTTKTDIDPDNSIWIEVRERMISMMRPVIDFLNELDADIESYTRERSPLHRLLEAQPVRSIDKVRNSRSLLVPQRESLGAVILYVKIQYSKEKDKVERLREALSLGSARATGEKCFDIVFDRQFDK